MSTEVARLETTPRDLQTILELKRGVRYRFGLQIKMFPDDVSESAFLNASDQEQARDVWAACLELIREKVNTQSFKTWFEPILPLRLRAGRLTVQVPSQFFFDWLEEHYYGVINATITKVLGKDAQLEYALSAEEPVTDAQMEVSLPPPCAERKTYPPQPDTFLAARPVDTPPPPPVAPTISSINPGHGSPGTLVVVAGTNLLGASAVSFNGQPAFSYSVVSASEIDAVVPATATTGTIRITTANGTATSPSFTVDAAQIPTLASFTPTTLSSGASVTLTGTHFVGATQVQFNGLNAASFTVLSDTGIRATAPFGLTAGTISVTTPGGTATSGTAYTVSSAVQVLMNTDFEQASPIIWAGDTGIIQGPPAGQPSVVPRSGSKFAWLGGYGAVQSDQITQDLYIPASATAATATAAAGSPLLQQQGPPPGAPPPPPPGGGGGGGPR